MSPATPKELQEALRARGRELLVLIAEDGTMRSTYGAPLLGARPARPDSRHVGQYVHPDDLIRILDLLERGRSSRGERETLLVRARHRVGHWVTLEVEATDARDDPVLCGFVLRISEASDGLGGQTTRDTRPQAMAPLLDGARQFESLAEIVPFGILSADRRGWVIYANSAATELFWLTGDQLVGSGWLDGICADDRLDVVRAAETALTSGLRPSVTFRIEIHGQTRWVNARFSPLHGSEGPSGWVATFTDVTSGRELEAELAHLATHDPLTGLPNRVLLLDRLNLALARLRRGEGLVSALFLDLDRFKPVNDEHGHATGDTLLVEIAARVRATVRASDTAARLGGDEFVVLSEGLSPDKAHKLARRLAEAVSEPIALGGHEVALTGCIGVALTDDPDVSGEELLARADEAMYRAKRRGTTIELAEGF